MKSEDTVRVAEAVFRRMRAELSAIKLMRLLIKLNIPVPRELRPRKHGPWPIELLDMVNRIASTKHEDISR